MNNKNNNLNQMLKLTDRIKFNSSDIKILHNEVKTEKELKSFISYFNIYKDFYDLSLITKTFLLYRQAIYEMVLLDKKLKENGITTPTNRLHANSLYNLQKKIKTNNDWNNFYDFWKKRKDRYCLGMILLKYRTEKLIYILD